MAHGPWATAYIFQSSDIHTNNTAYNKLNKPAPTNICYFNESQNYLIGVVPTIV